MNLFLEIIVVTCQIFKAIFMAILHTIVSPSPKSVEGEVVLITGSGSGLGRLMCLEFAKRGAVVVGWDVSKEGNRETEKQVEATGAKMFTYICDISRLKAIQKVAAQVREEVGEVTMLVNNAGIVTGNSFLDLPEDMIVKTMEINLLAHFWTIRTFLPSMLERNHGHIINIASMAGMIGANKMTDYCASKFGNVGMSESLDLEIVCSGKTGVHTTIVCPYFINTGMFDGAGTRFPRVFPVLDPVETVHTIMKAVLINQSMLCIPRIMYFMAALKPILPVEAVRIISRFTGASTLMDNFVGRKKVN